MATSSASDALQQVDLLGDVADVHAQGFGQALGRDAALDSPADHEVLLDRGQPVDAVVVGVALVIGGDQARRGLVAQIAQRNQADVPIEQ